MTIAAESEIGRGLEVSGRWIESSAFDLAFFILSPLAGLAVLVAYPVAGPLVAVAGAALIGGPHYLASFSFYLWEDAAPTHREMWFTYFAVPASIVALVAMVAIFRIPAVVILVVFFWNAWHVARQSCGILAIYRIRGGCTDQAHKRIANAAILSVSLCMAVWNLDWYPALHQLLSYVSPGFPRAIWLAACAASAISLAALGLSLLERRRQGAAPTAAEWAFLATSLTLFHPYLWVRDADLATLAMLMGHFIQYLAIIWLVNRRKYAHGPRPATAYGAFWREPRLILGAFCLAGVLIMFVQLNLAVVGICLALLHFYLDGVFWAFRRPLVRRMLGPYLTGWQRR